MNIYKVWRNEKINYDEWDAIVVIAPDANSALLTNPRGVLYPVSNQDGKPDPDAVKRWHDSWCFDRDRLRQECIGTAKECMTPRVILASFNAG